MKKLEEFLIVVIVLLLIIYGVIFVWQEVILPVVAVLSFIFDYAGMFLILALITYLVYIAVIKLKVVWIYLSR